MTKMDSWMGIRNEYQALYGIGEKWTDSYGKRCLLARRLVERGVRFVQLFLLFKARPRSGADRVVAIGGGEGLEQDHGELVRELGQDIKGVLAHMNIPAQRNLSEDLLDRLN